MKALILALLIPTAAVAEPGPTVRFLQNDPLTVWDFGAYRIEKLIEKEPFLQDSEIQIVSVLPLSYDWERNVLKIKLRVKVDYWAKGDDLKGQCKHYTDVVKGSLGIIVNKLWPVDDEDSNLSLYFSHVGFQKVDAPKDIASELDKITVIQVHISNTNNVVEEMSKAIAEGRKFKAEHVTCEAPLLGTDIYFKEVEK